MEDILHKTRHASSVFRASCPFLTIVTITIIPVQGKQLFPFFLLLLSVKKGTCTCKLLMTVNDTLSEALVPSCYFQGHSPKVPQGYAAFISHKRIYIQRFQQLRYFLETSGIVDLIMAGLSIQKLGQWPETQSSKVMSQVYYCCFSFSFSKLGHCWFSHQSGWFMQ